MQTTQAPPPQYTLPVVQPHLATHLPPNVKQGYKSHSVRRLAITQVVLGCFAFGFQMWDIINLSDLSVVGAGIWSGVFFIVTGCLGLVSANQRTVCTIVSYMIMSIFSSFMAMGLLVVSSINLSYYTDCGYYQYYCDYLTDYMKTSTIFLSSMLVIISVVEGMIAVIGASFACHGCCCSTPTQAFSYATPTQYVQGPNGELLLVTGQQPNTVTAMNGQQVLVTANPGGFQTLGLPMQANYQTPGFPAQPYITTVQTMPTQQPMVPPGSAPPPAYQTESEQATGNQQPEVHQSATNGKNNTAYVY